MVSSRIMMQIVAGRVVADGSPGCARLNSMNERGRDRRCFVHAHELNTGMGCKEEK